MGAVNEKTTRRNNYPVRMEMPAATPVASAPAPAAGAHATGGRIRAGVFDALTSGAAQMRRQLATNPITAVPVMLASALGSQNNRVAIRDFSDGLAGNPKGGVKVPVVPAAAVAAANPVDAALAAGRAATATPLTPQEQMLAQLGTILGSGKATMSDLKAVSGMLPAPGKHVPAKDVVIAETAEASKALYSDAVQKIMAQRAAGKLTEEQAQEMNAKAARERLLINLGLVGNPLSYTQANMLPAPDDEQE